MSIPLIQDNQKDSINASLIAIKREEERLQALIAEADKKIAQLNELKVNKSDIVDEVTLNNMQSVTSNAVASAFGQWEILAREGTAGGNEWVLEAIETKNGKYVHFYCQNTSFSRAQVLVASVPEKYRPTKHVVARCYFYQDVGFGGFINIQDNALIYPLQTNQSCWGDYITKID